MSQRNALTYFYAAFFTIGMVSFMQPYVINENLQIPAAIMLDADPFSVEPAAIKDIGVLTTVVGGQVVYRRAD